MNDDALRYPIGHWSAPATDAATLAALVDDIEAAPAALRAAVAGWTTRGWTRRTATAGGPCGSSCTTSPTATPTRTSA
jgi:hypothetical protein